MTTQTNNSNSSIDMATLSDADFAQLSLENQYKYLQSHFPEAQIDWKYSHNVIICERSKTVVEPLISQEFFVDYYREFEHKPINSPQVLAKLERKQTLKNQENLANEKPNSDKKQVEVNSEVFSANISNLDNDRNSQNLSKSNSNSEVNQNLPKQNITTTLQKLALEGIEEVEFLPIEYQERAAKYFGEIKNWCISRDLIWGHKMPVWYNLDYNPNRQFYTFSEFQANEIVGTTGLENGNSQNLESKKSSEIRVQDVFQISSAKPEKPGNWAQETKILDTWFSSTLWPLSTLDFAHFAQKADKIQEIDQDIEALSKILAKLEKTPSN